MQKAIIDLGTNTFHLLIIDENKKTIYRESNAAKIGKGGINQQVILPEAMDRAIGVLRRWSEKIVRDNIKPENVFAFGTSALRNANNAHDFTERVKQETSIEIEIISGEKEAELIYLGVKQAVEIKETSLIVDIGGGSVEFILCNEEKALWKQSIEIGGQRLMEIFMKSDPISNSAIGKMDDYFREKLLDLMNACHQYQPTVMIGSSGSFDTLNDMSWYKNIGELPPKEVVSFKMEIREFYFFYEKLIFSNREERMAIPGMVELRVEMIVVASCLIRYLIQTIGIKELKISNFALKEGVLSTL